MKFLFPIAAILISGTVFFTIISPWYSQVQELKVDVAAYNAALNSSASLEKTQQDLLTAYESVTPADMDRLNRFLPSSINNIEYILEIEQIANLHNMPIKNVKFGSVQVGDGTTTPDGSGQAQGVVVASDPANQKKYGVFPLEFTTQGNYESFLGFLKDLEYNLRVTDIQSISFEVPQVTKDNPGTSYDYTFDVNTYWLK